MARLVVGDYDFGIATIRTQEYNLEPVMDPTGKDLECVKITLSVLAIVNAVAFATHKKVEGSVGLAGAGDKLPDTMWNVRDYLMTPRRRIFFEVDGVVVLATPLRYNDGTRLTCDVKGGPFPQAARWTDNVGDKTMLLYFSVVTYQCYDERFMLSNRWRQTCSIGLDGYTTRTTTGRLCVRKDYCDLEGFMADDFRNLVVPKPPPQCRRVGIEVSQNEDGTEITYTATDREVTYGLGDFAQVLRIEGTVTSGADYPIKDAKQFIENLQESIVAQGISAINTRGVSLAVTVPRWFWQNAVPNTKALGIVRCYGLRNANRYAMYNICLAIILDRLAPLFASRGTFVSSYVTGNVDSDQAPWVEARAEFLGLSLQIIRFMIQGDISKSINFDPSFGNKLGQLVDGTTNGPSAAPVSRFTRGTYLTRMVAQRLATPAQSVQPPVEPPVPSGAFDQGSYF